MTTPAILFYDVVLAAHIACIVIAFGVTFAYPVMGPFVAKTNPRALPTFHAAQDLVGKRVIAPFGGLALLAGAYLASDRDLWSEVWVTVPLVILVALLIAGGAFFGPTEQKAAQLAQRDVDAAGDGPVQLSDEYQAVMKRIAGVGALSSLLVLVAVFFMAAKPFA
jgi:hypothetical protein